VIKIKRIYVNKILFAGSTCIEQSCRKLNVAILMKIYFTQIMGSFLWVFCSVVYMALHCVFFGSFGRSFEGISIKQAVNG
jgi:hypothetical protein